MTFVSSDDMWFVYTFLALAVILALLAYFVPPDDTTLCEDCPRDPDGPSQHWVNPF